MILHLSPEGTPKALELRDQYQTAAARAFPAVPGGTLTFAAFGPVKRPVGQHCEWVRAESLCRFYDLLLSGSDARSALDEAITFAREANRLHNARNQNYWSNQAYVDSGVDAIWGQFYFVRDHLTTRQEAA